MLLAGIVGYVYLAFVPGIGSLAGQWAQTMPDFVKMLPVDYQPSGSDMNLSMPTSLRWKSDRQPGGPGDYIEVMALRLVSTSLVPALAGERWAMAGHSSGGTVVYRGMELIADLIERPVSAALEISAAADRWLPAIDAEQLRARLTDLNGKPVSEPVAAISLEGSLLPCDVEGWAAELANPMSAAAQQLHGWEKVKQCTMAADLYQRCYVASPPRHLRSIRRWLTMKGGPPFVYFAGTRDGIRTDIVFPVLEAMLQSITAPAARLVFKMVPNSGHEMNADNAEGTMLNFEHVLSARAGFMSASERGMEISLLLMSCACALAILGFWLRQKSASSIPIFSTKRFDGPFVGCEPLLNWT